MILLLKIMFLIILLVTLTTFFCSYMLIRNKEIFNFRWKMIDKDNNKYKQLPSYDYMMWHFWVWPLDKFLPKENNQ